MISSASRALSSVQRKPSQRARWSASSTKEPCPAITSLPRRCRPPIRRRSSRSPIVGGHDHKKISLESRLTRREKRIQLRFRSGSKGHQHQEEDQRNIEI